MGGQSHGKGRTMDAPACVPVQTAKIICFCLRPDRLLWKQKEAFRDSNKQIKWVCFVLTCLHAFLNSQLNKLTLTFVLTLFPHKETWLQWSIFKIIIYVYTFCIYPA